MSDYRLCAEGSVIRTLDGACIPPDRNNTDYVAFLAWQAAGGTPSPASAPNPNESVFAQIAALEAQQTDRRVREAVLGMDGGWLAALNQQVAALRAQLEGHRP